MRRQQSKRKRLRLVAPKPRTFPKPCPTTGKIRFRSADDARLALARALLSPDPRRQECRHYQCPDCRDWHLTSWEARPAQPFQPASRHA